MKKLPKNGEQKIAPCFLFKKKKKARISFNCMLSTVLYADDKLSFQVREIAFKMPSRISQFRGDTKLSREIVLVRCRGGTVKETSSA